VTALACLQILRRRDSCRSKKHVYVCTGNEISGVCRLRLSMGGEAKRERRGRVLHSGFVRGCCIAGNLRVRDAQYTTLGGSSVSGSEIRFQECLGRTHEVRQAIVMSFTWEEHGNANFSSAGCNSSLRDVVLIHSRFHHDLL